MRPLRPGERARGGFQPEVGAGPDAPWARRVPPHPTTGAGLTRGGEPRHRRADEPPPGLGVAVVVLAADHERRFVLGDDRNCCGSTESRDERRDPLRQGWGCLDRADLDGNWSNWTSNIMRGDLAGSAAAVAPRSPATSRLLRCRPMRLSPTSGTRRRSRAAPGRRRADRPRPGGRPRRAGEPDIARAVDAADDIPLRIQQVVRLLVLDVLGRLPAVFQGPRVAPILVEIIGRVGEEQDLASPAGAEAPSTTPTRPRPAR
jgi:hypothetical protein